MIKYKFLAVLLALILLLGACGQAQESSALSTATPEPATSASEPIPSPTPVKTTQPDTTPETISEPTTSPTSSPAPNPTISADPSHAPGSVSEPQNATERPLKGIIIGIDPGHQAHSNSDPEPVAPGSRETKKKVSSGTQGRYTGVAEYKVNLQVGLKLKQILLDLGAAVVMTRESHDVDISNSARAVMMNDAGADLVVRLHCNGSDDTSKHGAFVLIPANDCTAAINDASKDAAKCILKGFIDATGAKDLGLQSRSDQTGFNWSTVPVCNVEMGHMTNDEEDQLLAADEYQNKCAYGIANGIVEYFG